VKKIISPSRTGVRGISSFLLGAAFLFSSSAWSASCCGGGGAATLVLPKFFNTMEDISFSYEQYHGFWNQQGEHLDDPPGSDLRQYRLTPGYAFRINPNWQASVVLPYVWNDNQYAGINSNTSGLGDATLGFWYENFDDIKCVYKVDSIKDLTPAAYFGASMTLPTGVSPYDDVKNSFDITGRGVYRLDANLLLDKTIFPWGMTVSYSYGVYIERDVNQEFGNFIEPYRKKMGNRRSASVGFAYTDTLEELNTVTYTITYADLQEAKSTIDGATDPTSGFEKQSVSFAAAHSTMDKDWIIRASFSHSFQSDDWGENFPATDVFSVGVSHVIP
jgi:hypothetical protein